MWGDKSMAEQATGNLKVTTGEVQVDTIAEATIDAGVTVDSVLIKDGEVDGRDPSVDGTKLDLIEASATADQTGAQIKSAYEAEANAFTDAQFTKLGDIEASADVTDAANVNTAGAVMEADYNAQTILQATSDNTPAPLAVAEQTLVGRITAGNIASLTATQIRTLLNVESGADVTGSNAPQAHAASHQNAGGDEISVLGLSGLLADDQHVLDAEVEAVITTEIVDGQSIDLAIDALIATHASSAEHDGRYYTETETDTWRSSTSQTEMGYLHGVSSDIQTQINGKTSYPAAGEQAFLDADHTKLNGIEALADVTDATNVASAGAFMESEADVKGDVFVATADNAISKLEIGTNDHVLTADSGKVTGVKWASPASGFADPMTTRGDIIIKNASNVTTRLGVGTNGQVITSDGTDISWGAAGAGTVDTSGTPVLNDFAKFTDADTIEGRNYTETRSDLGLVIGTNVLAEQTIGIANDNLVEMDQADAASGEYAKFTANGLESKSIAEVLSDLSVESGADATDAANVASAGAVMADTFDPQSILVAVADDTPAPLSIGEGYMVGRLSGGDIASLSATQIRTLLSVANGADVTGSNAPQAHAASHQNAGGDEISVAGLSGTLADDQHVLDTEVEAVITAEIVGGQSIDNAIDDLIATHAAVTTSHGISAFGATVVDDADAAAVRTTLGLVIGTNVLAEQTIGIADDNLVEIDGADLASGEIVRMTVNGIESRSNAEMKTQLGYLTELVDDTTPELSGTLEIKQKWTLYDWNLTADETASGWITSETIDANATGFGAALYLASDGHYEEADASGVATMPCTAIAVVAGTGTHEVLKQGYIRDDTWDWTVGGLIFISETTGALTQTAPTTALSVTQAIGIAKTADIIEFRPNLAYIVHG